MMNRRVVQPPGGDCHDIFNFGNGTGFGGSPSAPPHSNPHHRITKPPGGETSDIFTNPSASTPPSTPRKVKNYMASTIFTPGNEPRSVGRQRPEDDSFKRLFGVGNGPALGDGVDGTPRGKNHQKSNIFTEEPKAVVNGNGHSPIIGNGFGSPKVIAGDGHDSGSSSGNSSGSATPNGSVNGDAEPARHTNGTTNGTNGVSNGTVTIAPMAPPTRRVPPGGHCTQLW